MNNAKIHREELNSILANYDRELAELRDNIIHGIIDAILKLNKKGHRFSVSFDNSDVSIYFGHEGEYLKVNNRSFFSTTADLISALDQLEAMLDASAADGTEDDITMLFTKEGECDA